MIKKIFVLVVAVSIMAAFGACKKKEEQPLPQTPAIPAPGMPAANPHEGIAMPKGETQVVVPESVKGKWSGVKILIEDKATKKMQEATVKLGSEYKIPKSDLKIKVGDFLPDFRMDGLTITSASNQPNNPAVSVKVYEGDKEIFKGWLYSKFPTIHPFQNDKYGLILKEGVPKG